MSCRHCFDLEERKQAALHAELESQGFVSIRMRIVAAVHATACIRQACLAVPWNGEIKIMLLLN